MATVSFPQLSHCHRAMSFNVDVCNVLNRGIIPKIALLEIFGLVKDLNLPIYLYIYIYNVYIDISLYVHTLLCCTMIISIETANQVGLDDRICFVFLKNYLHSIESSVVYSKI